MLRNGLSELCFVIYNLNPPDTADCTKGGQLTQRQPVQRLATDMIWNENLINRLFTREKKSNGYKHRKWFSALLIIMKMHTKTKQRHDFVTTGLFKIRRQCPVLKRIKRNGHFHTPWVAM